MLLMCERIKEDLIDIRTAIIQKFILNKRIAASKREAKFYF